MKHVLLPTLSHCFLLKPLAQLFIVAAIKDAQGNLLINPRGRGRRFQAAGAQAVYGKRDNREFFSIDGPITDALIFLVREEKYD